jgi:hypothetical protein
LWNHGRLLLLDRSRRSGYWRTCDGPQSSQPIRNVERKQFWVAILIEKDTLLNRHISTEYFLLPYHTPCLEQVLQQSPKLRHLLQPTENDSIRLVVDQSHDLLWNTYNSVKRRLHNDGHELVVHPFGISKQPYQVMLERLIGQVKLTLDKLSQQTPYPDSVYHSAIPERSINRPTCDSLARSLHISIGSYDE